MRDITYILHNQDPKLYRQSSFQTLPPRIYPERTRCCGGSGLEVRISLDCSILQLASYGTSKIVSLHYGENIVDSVKLCIARRIQPLPPGGTECALRGILQSISSL